MKTAFVLFIFSTIAGHQQTSIPGFTSHAACQAAGERIVNNTWRKAGMITYTNAFDYQCVRVQ